MVDAQQGTVNDDFRQNDLSHVLTHTIIRVYLNEGGGGINLLTGYTSKFPRPAMWIPSYALAAASQITIEGTMRVL